MSRFWSTFWTVAGFLFLMGLLQMIADSVFTLFGVVPYFAPTAVEWVLDLSQAVVPIWGMLTFIDWKWGWKSDTAGLRTTPAAVFWLFPGLLAGAAAVGLAGLVGGALNGGGFPAIALDLGLASLATMAVLAVQAFGMELAFRGVVVSRVQSDLSGQNLLVLAIGLPFAWWLAQRVLGDLVAVPETGIEGLGTAALSVFLTLLFLRTDSVWLAAGIRVVPLIIVSRLGLPAIESGLLIVFGVPALILLLLEISKMRTVRRPPGPRRGQQRTTYGKTVRGPWGPH